MSFEIWPTIFLREFDVKVYNLNLLNFHSIVSLKYNEILNLSYTRKTFVDDTLHLYHTLLNSTDLYVEWNQTKHRIFKI